MCDYSDVACDFLCLLCCDLTFRMIIAVDSPSSSQELLISQEMTTSWVFKGERHYRYEVRVKNNSAKTLQSLKLLVMDLHGPLWGLSKTGPMTYTFPTWMKSLTSKQSFVFIYIQKHNQPFVELYHNGNESLPFCEENHSQSLYIIFLKYFLLCLDLSKRDPM